MKKLLMILFFVLLAFGSAKADSYTNLFLVLYNADTQKICVPSKTNECCEITWTQLVGQKSNWGYIQGDGDQSCQETVTFSNSFSSIPDVTINFAGFKANSVPTNRGDASVSAGAFATAQMVATNQFTAVISSTANIATNVYVLYTWIAKPQSDD